MTLWPYRRFPRLGKGQPRVVWKATGLYHEPGQHHSEACLQGQIPLRGEIETQATLLPLSYLSIRHGGEYGRNFEWRERLQGTEFNTAVRPHCLRIEPWHVQSSPHLAYSRHRGLCFPYPGIIRFVFLACIVHVDLGTFLRTTLFDNLPP